MTTPGERDELDEYERLDHLMVMIKSGNFGTDGGTAPKSCRDSSVMPLCVEGDDVSYNWLLR